LKQPWVADDYLDGWIDAAIGTDHVSRDGRPARVSKNFAVLLRHLAYVYGMTVTFRCGVGGWESIVGGLGEYDDQSFVHDSPEVSLAVATLLYFHPPKRWIDAQRLAG